MPVRSKRRSSSLETLVAALGEPPHPMQGRRPAALALPENIACFQRRSAADLNRPRRGRALHHRFVLICALRTAVTVGVDDRAVRLASGEGLLVFPFQFHHYLDAERETLRWLYVTFELPPGGPELESLRFRPFALNSEVRSLLAALVASYESRGQDDLVALLLALLLARLRRLGPVRDRTIPTPTGIVTRVNVLAQSSRETLRVRDLAAALGISASHLRERFRASCGVSLGRHVRRLRLEKACGLLRLTPNRVSEIAEQCGFSSIYSFSRAFHAAYGVAPLAYRRGAPSAGGRAVQTLATPP